MQSANFWKNLKLGDFLSPISTPKNANFDTKLGIPLKVLLVNPFWVSNPFLTLPEKNAPTFCKVPISKKKSQIGGFLSQFWPLKMWISAPKFQNTPKNVYKLWLNHPIPSKPNQKKMRHDFMQSPNFWKNLKLMGFLSPISTTKNANFGTKLGMPLKVLLVNPFWV